MEPKHTMTTPNNDVNLTPPQANIPAKARHFAQTFGLDPRIAFLTIVLDTMLFGGAIATWGLIVPFAIATGIVLVFITYKAQIKWYGDDPESALIKGVILGLLTSIPTPLPPILFVPSGILGLIHNLRRQ